MSAKYLRSFWFPSKVRPIYIIKSIGDFIARAIAWNEAIFHWQFIVLKSLCNESHVRALISVNDMYSKQMFANLCQSLKMRGLQKEWKLHIAMKGTKVWKKE